MPDTWQDRLNVSIASLVKVEQEPQTIVSYISAIKAVLRTENNFISDDSYVLSSIYHRHIEHFVTFLAGNTVFSLVSESPR